MGAIAVQEDMGGGKIREYMVEDRLNIKEYTITTTRRLLDLRAQSQYIAAVTEPGEQDKGR